MVKIPYIKIPSVRVGSIVPTSNIGTGGATPAPPSPSPITYLTQWQMLGNSQVHTDPFLTSWKVSGNSVVDNNTILSCGDLGQDGKYHVKISNGVTIYDIPLTEPLRKVNDVADSIEFSNGSAVVTRTLGSTDLGDLSWLAVQISSLGTYRMTSRALSDCKVGSDNSYVANFLNVRYKSISVNSLLTGTKSIAVNVYNKNILVYDENYNQSDSASAFKAAMAGVELIYELETPTTEVIQVSPFPISPTDTYTSANDTPYSAFEYKKNVEIWSCGEYSAVDGKYHILVQPEGGSIADIALDEPLRKVNDVADNIEFANGVATVTRAFDSAILSNLSWTAQFNSSTNKYRYLTSSLKDSIKYTDNAAIANLLCAIYNTVKASDAYATREQGIGMAVSSNGGMYIYDDHYNSEGDSTALLAHINGAEIIYELATPTTETIQVPLIQEADSYSCVIGQGGKAVSWSSFETNSE